jgi:hypothetical protein
LYSGRSELTDEVIGSSNVYPELIPIVPGLLLKYGGAYGSGGSGAGSGGPVGAGGLPDVANNGLEEGYIDLNGIKEVESGSKDLDISSAMKRYIRRIMA